MIFPDVPHNTGPQPGHVYCLICGGDISKQFPGDALASILEGYGRFQLCLMDKKWLKATWDYWNGKSPRQRGERDGRS